jgi:hypothetical protein
MVNCLPTSTDHRDEHVTPTQTTGSGGHTHPHFICEGEIVESSKTSSLKTNKRFNSRDPSVDPASLALTFGSL